MTDSIRIDLKWFEIIPALTGDVKSIAVMPLYLSFFTHP